MRLCISRSLLKELVSHCRRELPNEACGLLAGSARRVLSVMPLPNVATNPGRNYLVEEAAQVRAFRLMAEKEWELVGIYHSHPTKDAVPSQSDIRQSYYPQAIHLIVSLRRRSPDVRAYRLVREAGKCVRVRLDVYDPPAGVQRWWTGDLAPSKGGWYT